MEMSKTDVAKEIKERVDIALDSDLGYSEFDLGDLAKVIEIASRRIEHGLSEVQLAIERQNAIHMCAEGESPSNTMVNPYSWFDETRRGGWPENGHGKD